MSEFTKLVVGTGWPKGLDSKDVYNWLHSTGLGGNWTTGDNGFKIEYRPDTALCFEDPELALLFRLRFGL